MKINLRTFFLRSLPYLMSIAGGIVLYTGAIDNAPNDNIRDLVINVSASLLSIPLVFLLYDYTNSRINRQMRQHMASTVGDRLNSIMLNLISVLRDAMGVRSKLTVENLNRMLMWRVPEISRRLKVTLQVSSSLHECHQELDNLLYHNNQSGVLSPDQIQILSSLSRELTRLINENKFHKNRRISAKYTENIMSRILDWLDSDTVAAIMLANHLAETIGPGAKIKK
ncbi:MAG: hypothetical protein J6R99_03505 [Alphaproteobacteria bacterium]|nr:hypothetical protein [Alphaproteobacteria bacterium]